MRNQILLSLSPVGKISGLLRSGKSEGFRPVDPRSGEAGFGEVSLVGLTPVRDPRLGLGMDGPE